MIRFDANGNPIPDNNGEQAYTSNGEQTHTQHEYTYTEEVDPNDPHNINSSINTSYQPPMERVSGFEIARRAVVHEMAKKNQPVVGAALAGIGYAVEAFFGTIKNDEKGGRSYAN